jgi:hypothetical protein
MAYLDASVDVVAVSLASFHHGRPFLVCSVASVLVAGAVPTTLKITEFYRLFVATVAATKPYSSGVQWTMANRSENCKFPKALSSQILEIPTLEMVVLRDVESLFYGPSFAKSIS